MARALWWLPWWLLWLPCCRGARAAVLPWLPWRTTRAYNPA